MAKYYFITTFLPQLKVGAAPELDSGELEFLLRMNLTASDYEKVSLLRRFVEMENLRHFWKDEPIETGGNFDQKAIEENLLHRENYPSYVFEYMDRYETKPLRLQHFSELLAQFFRVERKKEDGFAQRYLNFEWKWRLVMTALRAVFLKRDLAHELRFEDQDDPFVQTILDQKSVTDFTPPDDFLALKEIYEEKQDDPLELNLALFEWRFSKIEEMIGWHTFDIDRVLGYVAQLDIVEKWLQFDKRKGLEFVHEKLQLESVK